MNENWQVRRRLIVDDLYEYKARNIVRHVINNANKNCTISAGYSSLDSDYEIGVEGSSEQIAQLMQLEDCNWNWGRILSVNCLFLCFRLTIIIIRNYNLGHTLLTDLHLMIINWRVHFILFLHLVLCILTQTYRHHNKTLVMHHVVSIFVILVSSTATATSSKDGL